MLPVRSKCIFLFAATAFFAATGAIHTPAWGQSKLDAQYVATLAGIPIGKGAWYIDISDTHFTTAASGRTTGLLQVFAGGQGTVAARGTVSGGRPVPGAYAANIITDKKFNEVRMAIVGGNISELSAEPPQPASRDRIPVTDTHHRGVLDPMSAVLMAVTTPGKPLSAEACNRKLPIFDGRGRFDLVLAYKRTEQVKAKDGYQGPAVVCSVRYHPIAGHRPSLAAVKYLVTSRDMEVWLAPLSGAGILVPFRVYVPTVVGPAVLEATKFLITSEIERPAPPKTWSQHMGLRLRSLD